MSLNGNLSLDLSQTLSSSTKNPNILLNNDKKDETYKEEDFYLNQSIIKQRKSNVFSDEEEFDDL